MAGIKLPAADILKEVKDEMPLGYGDFAEVFSVTYRGRPACLKVALENSNLMCAPELFTNEAKMLVRVAGAGGAPTLLAFATGATHHV